MILNELGLISKIALSWLVLLEGGYILLFKKERFKGLVLMMLALIYMNEIK